MTVAAALRRAEARYQRASRALREAEQQRDEAIRTAHREGMAQRAIAEHVGISHQRVAQITRAD